MFFLEWRDAYEIFFHHSRSPLNFTEMRKGFGFSHFSLLPSNPHLTW